MVEAHVNKVAKGTWYYVLLWLLLSLGQEFTVLRFFFSSLFPGKD